MESALVSWIGRTDLRASRGDPDVGLGPIAQAVLATKYAAVHLISDFEDLESQEFCRWLVGKTGATVKLHSVKLSSPINFSEIYQGVISVLEGVRKKESPLTYHLSPGTPAMQSVWILLAKTTHPAKLIQSSQESGVQDTDIPFDIAAEFIPQLLKQSDELLTQISQGAVIDTPEFSDIVHRSHVMKRVIAHSRRVALRSIPVLIEGESGTGKELLARAIHKASPRSDKPFVSVNCGAIPSELVESEFFGHKKGAFTGAIADRKGYFESAHLGTLFLDEVGELPLYMQVKLLRALQEREVVPVGSVEPRKVNVRVIAATNRTLIEEVSDGRFRDDLFYRLRAEIQVGIITFSGTSTDVHLPLTSAHQILETKTMIARGKTPMGAAFDAVRTLLEDRDLIPARAYRPALVLISDGLPNDDWEPPLSRLQSSERAKKATRFAMSIGDDANDEMLSKFLNDKEAPLFKAHEARDIHRFFKAITMSVTSRTSSANPDITAGINLSELPDGDELDLDF